jgi:hypothetical protein
MPAPPKKYEFEGEMLTVAEIQKRVPRLTDPAIRKHLAAGRNTQQAILNHNGKPAKRGFWHDVDLDIRKKSG